MTVEFGPVTRQTVTEQVRARLAERIASGELAPGAPVPAERTLCEQFGVARTSVREALQGLVSLGLVERRGNRCTSSERLPEVAFATPDETPPTRASSSSRELFETRRVLELPIAELASVPGDADERDAIRARAQEFWAGMPLDEFRRLDRRFHSLIADACGNPLLVELYGKVLDALFELDEFESLLFHEAEPRAGRRADHRASIAEHQAIAKAFVDGDRRRRGRRVRAHLADVEQRMVDDLV